MFNTDKYKHRAFIIKIVLCVIVAIFIIRLFQLQIIEDYSGQASRNAFYNKVIYSPRGLIYDRNGKLLVYNQPTYDLLVTMSEIPGPKSSQPPIDTLELCNLLNITKEQFDARIASVKDRRKNPGYSPLTPQRFITQMSPEDYAIVQEKLRNFPGFSIQSRTLRNYNYAYASHVLGSIGEVSRSVLETDSTYRMGDYIGVSGLEKQYEKQLRGTNGAEILLRDAFGRIKGSYQDGAFDVTPVPGEDLITTLDIELQKIAEDLLQGKIGSVVAIEPKTGEILALASSPTWDPTHLVGRERSKYYPLLQSDKTKPLLNRAIQGKYSPGSTFKTIQALVCLEMGGITENTMFPCNGPGSAPIKCTHHHGSPVSIENAIEQSCNPFFWQAFRATLEKNGYGKNNETFKARYTEWRERVFSFGLGYKFSDSDVIGMIDGSIYSENSYSKIYGKRGWKALTIRSNAIGQGEVEVTPIQLANVAAAIANSGYYITPHLNKNDTMLNHRHQVAVQEKYFPIVQRGMWRVCEYGTGRHYKVPDIPMCGKTGTTDNSHGRPHSIFFGYAPADNPQIAIAVIIENAGFGSTWACPIATLCIEQYLKGKIERQDLYNRIKTSVLNPNVKKF